jgi:two-component system, OmpR family, sensor kinase
MRSQGLRHRLFIVVLLAVALVVTALVVGFNLVLARTLDKDANDLVRSRAAAQLNSLRLENGRITVGEAPDGHASDAFVWVFEGSRVLERPRVASAVDEAARRLAAGRQSTVDISSTDSRLYAVPVVEAGGRRVGTVVAGVSLGPYEETRVTALVASAVFGALVLLIVGGATWWLLGASLRPVVRMTRQAAVWSERDLDHRFALGPPHDELTELAATLDRLLDRLAASLRRERRFSAELSHELRTPLAHVLAETELALSRDRRSAEYREALQTIRQSAEQLSRTVEALVAAAVYEAGGRGTADAEQVAVGVVDACARFAKEQEIEIEMASPPRPLRVGVDRDLAQRILQPVVENACRYGSGRVRVAVERQDSSVLYAVEDDGPGVAEDERERIFEPGARGSASGANGSAGAGLGLSLVRRLVRAVHGDVYADSPTSGARFVVRLPAG